jgi:hypothetical protein
VIGRPARASQPIGAAAALVAVVSLSTLIAACGPTPAPSSVSASPTGSLAPAETAESSQDAGSPSASGSPAASVTVDPTLLANVPASVDGIALTFDPETSATIAADPAVAHDAAGLAVALAVAPGASGADDLAIVSVIKLRDPAKDEAWFRDWRDTYDQGACGPAGGVVGNAEAQLGGGTVFIGSCEGGVHTYHTRIEAAGIVVSITALGDRRLGEKVMESLGR